MDTKLECEVDVDVEGAVDMMIHEEDIRKAPSMSTKVLMSRRPTISV